jgi:hypothetical protein
MQARSYQGSALAHAPHNHASLRLGYRSLRELLLFSHTIIRDTWGSNPSATIPGWFRHSSSTNTSRAMKRSLVGWRAVPCYIERAVPAQCLLEIGACFQRGYHQQGCSNSTQVLPSISEVRIPDLRSRLRYVLSARTRVSSEGT